MKERKMFHEGLIKETEDGVFLRAARCSKCGKIQFPAKDLCTECLSEEKEEQLIGNRGTIYTVTTTYSPVSGFLPPLTIAYVETKEGLRVFAPLKTEEEPYEIGMEVELSIADLWEEKDAVVTGYRYQKRQ